MINTNNPLTIRKNPNQSAGCFFCCMNEHARLANSPNVGNEAVFDALGIGCLARQPCFQHLLLVFDPRDDFEATQCHRNHGNVGP